MLYTIKHLAVPCRGYPPLAACAYDSPTPPRNFLKTQVSVRIEKHRVAECDSVEEPVRGSRTLGKGKRGIYVEGLRPMDYIVSTMDCIVEQRVENLHNRHKG